MLLETNYGPNIHMISDTAFHSLRTITQKLFAICKKRLPLVSLQPTSKTLLIFERQTENSLYLYACEQSTRRVRLLRELCLKDLTPQSYYDFTLEFILLLIFQFPLWNIYHTNFSLALNNLADQNQVVEFAINMLLTLYFPSNAAILHCASSAQTIPPPLFQCPDTYSILWANQMIEDKSLDKDQFL